MTILDVRSKEEFDEQHLPQATNWDFQSGQAIPKINKDEQLVIHCRSGGRAERALAILKDAGFTDAINAGGLEQAQAILNEYGVNSHE